MHPAQWVTLHNSYILFIIRDSVTHADNETEGYIVFLDLCGWKRKVLARGAE